MKKQILVAPLNWGIGHASRCISIINWLLVSNFKPIIASDGEALLLLQKEFPEQEFIELPAFNITYQKSGKHLKLKLLRQLPHIVKTLKAERKITKSIIILMVLFLIVVLEFTAKQFRRLLLHTN